MQALVVGGRDGYCFIEKDASFNSRAGIKAPRKGSLVSPSLLIRQLPACAGTPPFHPTGPARALFRWMARNAVLFTKSSGFLSSLSQ